MNKFILIILMLLTISFAQASEKLVCTDSYGATKEFTYNDNFIQDIIDAYMQDGEMGRVNITANPPNKLYLTFFISEGGIRHVACFTKGTT